MSASQSVPHPEPGSVTAEMKAAARAAHLRYVSDTRPGIRRVRTAKGFRYVAPDGSRITDEGTISRIQKLAIPPAYEDVWICPDPNGHLQAVGRDARGRKQYRYHARWRQVRDESKYAKMLVFGRVLPRIRTRVEHDLALRGMQRERVLAAAVRLLETTMMRVGNEEYAKANKSYGLTTLRNRHVKVEGGKIHFDFRGKHGLEHHIDLTDRRLARIIKRLQDLPGQDLFEYVDDDGTVRSVTSEDVNEYLREITGEDITAKDFRTWAATNLAAVALKELEKFELSGESKKERRAGGGSGVADAGQHADDLPQVLHPPGDFRRVPGRIAAGYTAAAGRGGAGRAAARLVSGRGGGRGIPQPPAGA